jgi:hypothetical protein
MQVRNNICLSLCIFPMETDFHDLLCRSNGRGISEENCRIDIVLYPWYYKNLIIVVEKRIRLCQKKIIQLQRYIIARRAQQWRT